jgi:uncharacterized protein (TIGR02246 family)
MNRLSIVIGLALLSAAESPAETSRSADEAAIKAQLYGYAAARTVGEGHAQALFYTEDGDEWGSAAREMTKGRAAIEKTLTSPPNPNRVFKVEPINYSFLGDDVALVDATYGGVEPAGHALYVMVKRDGKWLIRSARIMRFPPPK